MKASVPSPLMLTAITLATVSSSHAYHVTPPTASFARNGRSSQSLYSLKITSSSFFGIGATRRSLFSIPNGENKVEVEVQSLKSAESSNDDSNSLRNDVNVTETSSTSFLQTIDKWGMKLKPMALAAHDKNIQIKSSNVNGQSDQQGGVIRAMLYSIKSNVLWMLYILYRGYRGFFVILPAVFREVFRQLEESNVAMDAFGDENNEISDSSGQQQPMRLRTRITVSVLSGILTLSYVLSGAFRVLGKFLKTFTTTTSVESSLHAAADEVELNEDKLRRNKAK